MGRAMKIPTSTRSLTVRDPAVSCATAAPNRSHNTSPTPGPLLGTGRGAALLSAVDGIGAPEASRADPCRSPSCGFGLRGRSHRCGASRSSRCSPPAIAEGGEILDLGKFTIHGPELDADSLD